MKLLQLSSILFILLTYCVGYDRNPTSYPQETIVPSTATSQTDIQNVTTPSAQVQSPDAQTPTGTKFFLPTVTVPEKPNDGWWTVAGNSQRTSWSPEQVSGDLHVEWYRPIDAYISQNTQVIASNGMLYISTARGLYALDAATGALRWRFDTELPIGNSPTVAGGVVYVGGFDHKLHALNATTGDHLWSFDGATAGYSANPLVISGKVIIGNRDGAMYAIGAQGTAQQGKLIWKYKTGGPIMLTAAAKDGIVYFAANDNYAYALRINTTNVNGELAWKSQKMPGDGFQSYWPVITTDPATGQDRVIFSTASGYRIGTYPPGLRSVLDLAYFEKPEAVHDELFTNPSNPTSVLGTIIQIKQPWAQSKTILDYSRVTEYLENNPDSNPDLHKPWRRSYIILNTSNGSEYSLDSDNDGFNEYVPVIPYGTTNGSYYPPVVGNDGLLYFNNLYNNNNQGKVMGWRMGTPYMTLTSIQGAMDEPQALSSGGNMIYRSICCDRVGDYIDSSDPGPNYYSPLWSYFSPLSDQALGYDQKWWFLDSGLERLYGNYGGPNGIYHNHGDQNPIVPYNGRTYILRSNAIIAYGKGTSRGMLAKINPNPVQDSVVQPSLTDLK